MNQSIKISFIGFGHLARALVHGALQANALHPDMLVVTSPSLIQQKIDCPFKIALTNQDAVSGADVIVLAVKPQQVALVCHEIAEMIECNQLIVSVATGKTTAAIIHYLNKTRLSVIRAMPNTAVAVQEGVTALYHNEYVTVAQRDFVHTLFKATGAVIDVDKEDDIDLITALFGSGPAYFLYLQEALETAAVKRGLSIEVAQLLTKQTMYGTSLLTHNSPVTFQEKRVEVTSMRGTTAAAIAYLESHDFMQLIDTMIEKAYLRAKELSTSS